MSWTLQDVQNAIASEVDQSASSPTEGGTDWNIRTNFINRSLIDWSETYEWESLKKIHNGIISTSTGNASYALPADFKKMDGFPQITADGMTTYGYPVDDPTSNTRYVGTDRFVNILGNERDNKVMYIHGGALASGASVQFTYYASPQSLASANDIIVMTDPTYLVQRSLYYILKSREDGRFPEAKTESDRILMRMIENENTLGQSHVERTISVFPENYKSWRVGRD
jgi:predicted Rdx family selenoprotein